jgi:uncharacterized protein YkwD
MCAMLAMAVAACLAALPAASAEASARARQASGACPGASLLPSAANTATVEQATLCLINRIRATHRMRTLRANRELLGVAASQVTTMLSWDYFADVRPSGQTPLALVGVTHYPAHAADIAVGQNIAWGTKSYSSPAHIVGEWMASPPHRAVILTGEYRDAGVAVKAGVPGVLNATGRGATYAMEFGARRF